MGMGFTTLFQSSITLQIVHCVLKQTNKLSTNLAFWCPCSFDLTQTHQTSKQSVEFIGNYHTMFERNSWFVKIWMQVCNKITTKTFTSLGEKSSQIKCIWLHKVNMSQQYTKYYSGKQLWRAMSTELLPWTMLMVIQTGIKVDRTMVIRKIGQNNHDYKAWKLLADKWLDTKPAFNGSSQWCIWPLQV